MDRCETVIHAMSYLVQFKTLSTQKTFLHDTSLQMFLWKGIQFICPVLKTKTQVSWKNNIKMESI